MRALVIEDDVLNGQILIDLIEDNHPEIVVKAWTKTKADSIKFLQEEAVDLIFLDLELPDGHGFEVLRETDQEIKVIVTTSGTKTEELPVSIHVNSWLVKPINSGKLKNAIHSSIKH